MIRRTVVTILVLAGAMSRVAAGQPPQDLIDSVIAAYGGREALARVTSYEMRGTLTAVNRGGPVVTLRRSRR